MSGAVAICQNGNTDQLRQENAADLSQAVAIQNTMTKAEAAALLGCSERQIERYASAGKISVRMEPGKTRKTPVYDERELLELKAELERPTYKAAVVRHEVATGADNNDGAQSRQLSLLPNESQLQALQQLFAAMAPQTPGAQIETTRRPSAADLAGKMWLTLDEAETITGISKGVIRAAIKAERLTARRDLGRGQRLSADELAKWAKKP